MDVHLPIWKENLSLSNLISFCKETGITEIFIWWHHGTEARFQELSEIYPLLTEEMWLHYLVDDEVFYFIWLGKGVGFKSKTVTALKKRITKLVVYKTMEVF